MRRFAKPSIHYSFRRDGRICCTRRAGSEGRAEERVAGKGGAGAREGWTSKFITGRGRCPPAGGYIYFLAERVPRLKSREQKSPWRQRNSILMNLLCFSYRVPRAQPSYSTIRLYHPRARATSNSISPHNYAPFFEFSSTASTVSTDAFPSIRDISYSSWKTW